VALPPGCYGGKVTRSSTRLADVVRGGVVANNTRSGPGDDGTTNSPTEHDRARALKVSADTLRRWEHDGLDTESLRLEDWASIKEVAKALSVSSKTVRRWITNGQVEARRFGPKLIRIRISSIPAVSQLIVWSAPARLDET
jgi:excisionase family DNA binding protein